MSRTTTLHDLTHQVVGDLAYKLSGISRLLQGYSPEGHDEREYEDLHGLGLLVEALSGEGQRIALLLERSENVDPKLPIEIRKYDRDPIGTALKAVESVSKTDE